MNKKKVKNKYEDNSLSNNNLFNDNIILELNNNNNNLYQNIIITTDSRESKWWRNINKNEGLYLINFNIIYNYESGISTLIYKYIKYNNMFDKFIISYINEIQSKSVFMDWDSNNFIFIIDKILNSYNTWDKEYYKLFINNNEDIENIPLNLIEYLLIISEDGPKYFDINNMINFINYLYQKDNQKILEYYENRNMPYKYSDVYPKNIDNKIISNFIFLVKDIKSLVDKFINININEGPQKWRGQCDLISNNLLMIDKSFRKSMYNHYKKHYNIYNSKI